jgi:hypothetical protein
MNLDKIFNNTFPHYQMMLGKNSDNKDLIMMKLIKKKIKLVEDENEKKNIINKFIWVNKLNSFKKLTNILSILILHDTDIEDLKNNPLLLLKYNIKFYIIDKIALINDWWKLNDYIREKYVLLDILKKKYYRIIIQ